MRVLVTGAFGFVGAAVTRRLLEAGREVVALTSRQPAPAGEVLDGIDVQQGDIRDAAAMRAVMENVDAVCHLAALTRVRESFDRPADYWAVNRDGTRNIVEAAMAESVGRGRIIRCVLASTGAVYGSPERQPITEDTPADPSNAYGQTKIAAEQEVLGVPLREQYGAVVLRAFNVAGAVDGHGDSDTTRIIPKALAVAARRAPVLQINGDGQAVRDFVHVDDFARAMLAAIDHAEPGRRAVFNVGGTGATVSEIVQVTEQITGRVVTVEYLPPKPEPRMLLADTTRIRNELGWKPERSSLWEIIADGWAAVIR